MLRADSRHGLSVLLGSSALCTALWLPSINGAIGPGPLFWDNVHWTVSAAIASWMVVRAVRQTDATNALRRTRIWLAAAVLANLGGSIVYDVESAVGYFEIPGYNVAVFILIGPCLLLAFIDQLRKTLPDARRGVVFIDLGGFSLAALVLVLAIYLPLFTARIQVSTFNLLIFSSYPVLQFSAAAAALVLNLHARQRWTLEWQALFLAVCVQGVIWTIWNLTVINTSFVPWSVLNLGFSFVTLALGWGAAFWEPRVNTAEGFDRLCEGLLRLLPLLNVALATTAITLLAAQRSLIEPAHAILLGCALAALLIAVVRQTLQLRERDKLIDAERAVAESQAQLQYLAHHDPLTGLPNLTLLRNRVEHAIESAKKKHLRAALLFLDLDQFKDVNDTFGHATGDALLCHVAGQLQSSLQGAEVVSRQGGDEFTVVLADVRGITDVVRVAPSRNSVATTCWSGLPGRCASRICRPSSSSSPSRC